MDAWVVVDTLAERFDGRGAIPSISGRVFHTLETGGMALLFNPVDDARTIESALNGATASGLISEAQGSAIRDALKMQAARVYVASFGLESYAPPGNYGVDVWLADATGAEIYRASTGFVYQSVSAFDLDFSIVDFGKVAAATSSYVLGDDRFALNDGWPTIKNVGNVPLRLEVRFRPMVNESGTVQIADLSARFLGERLDSSAGGPLAFSNLLLPGQTAAIDFWFEPPADVPMSTYFGSMSISSRAP